MTHFDLIWNVFNNRYQELQSIIDDPANFYAQIRVSAMARQAEIRELYKSLLTSMGVEVPHIKSHDNHDPYDWYCNCEYCLNKEWKKLA